MELETALRQQRLQTDVTVTLSSYMVNRGGEHLWGREKSDSWHWFVRSVQ